AILFVSMIMTTVDVVGRYLFNSPLGFAYEVTALLMATVVFVALPSVTLHREHISIGLFEGVWRGRIGALRDLAIALLIAACMAFLCYRMFLFVGRFMSYGDRTDTLKFPLYPVAALGAVGIGLAGLAALTLAFYAGRRLVRGG
ncbi:MAG: TRAP transporter small permease, partial [Propylenella sp.]